MSARQVHVHVRAQGLTTEVNSTKLYTLSLPSRPVRVLINLMSANSPHWIDVREEEKEEEEEEDEEEEEEKEEE